jgi:BirA family biotin operon repressor/biotin-[acetyl-CoA-carboxylase] ligase
MKRWRELTPIIGQQVEIQAIGKVYTGEVIDVDTDGTLVLKDHLGQVQRVLCGDLCVTG